MMRGVMGDDFETGSQFRLNAVNAAEYGGLLIQSDMIKTTDEFTHS
jgi:hypothetical protein